MVTQIESRLTSPPGRLRALARGFSLIELMMVVVLIGIALVVATPNFNRYRWSLARKQATGQILDDLRSARQLAITRHMPVIVRFGNGSTTTNVSSYQIHCDKNYDGVIQSTEFVKNSAMPRNTLMSKVTLTPTDSLIYDISGLLRSGTTGGKVIVKTNNGPVDTLIVSIAGMVYEQ